MTKIVSLKFEILKPLDLNEKVAKQIPYAISKALNQLAYDGREDAVDRLHKVFTVRNEFVERGVQVTRSTKKNLTAIIGIEDRRGFMEDQIDGGPRHPSADKAGSAVPVAARAKPTDKVTPSKFAGALLTKDEARKTRRLFFSQLGGDRLMLLRRLRKRSSRSRGVLKRRYKGREAGTPLKPREVVEVVYVFSKDVQIKARWPFPAIVEKAVADHWDTEMWYALQRALDEAD